MLNYLACKELNEFWQCINPVSTRITVTADDILNFFSYFSKKKKKKKKLVNISCESSAWQTINLKCQELFSLRNKKKKNVVCYKFCFALEGLMLFFLFFPENMLWYFMADTQESCCPHCCRWRHHRPPCHHQIPSHIFCFRSVTSEGMHWFHLKSAEVYITVKYRSRLILVIIHQILAESWPFFDLVFVVGSVSFEGMQWFHEKFAEGYIIVRYRSNLILVIIHKMLAELWPFFNLVFVVLLILVSSQ